MQPDVDIRRLTYRPIRPDGTPVDWEVLDQEVARVAGAVQPQGFRADLWRRIREETGHETQQERYRLDRITELTYVGAFFRGPCSLTWLGHHSHVPDHIAARWTVYQELKPLYDIVDGAQGEAAMPRDVEAEWDRQAGYSEIRTDGDWSLYRNTNGLFAQSPDGTTWFASDFRHGHVLRNFAAVLDAVAEHRVAEQLATAAEPTPSVSPLREQRTPQPRRINVEPTIPINPEHDTLVASRLSQRAQSGRTVTSAQPATPEPRRFADVRPDRHGWRWWRQTGRDSTDLGQRFETLDGRCRWRSAHADAWFVPDTANPQMLRYTVIPTDEQGNPVSWESIGVRLNSPPASPAQAFFSAEPPTPPHLGQFSNNLATPPLTPEGAANLFLDTLNREAEQYGVPVGTGAKPARTEAITTLPLPLPRFTADELDDVDHSKTTKLDEVTLRRGKLPTVEQIAKYRELRARRTGGAVADALKESRIDCEVAQHVLERWAGGLGDANVLAVIEEVRFLDCAVDVDKRAAWFIGLTCGATLDTAEKSSPIVQRERQEAEERRQRLAELRQRLVAERAAQPTEEAPTTTSRFDLIEPDPQADPAASIRAWEARQAAAKVRPAAVPPRIAKPAAAPRRPAIEVVDAEVDGLSRSEVVTALFGRAFNGGC